MNSTWKRNSKGQQSHIDKLLSSFQVSMRAIYFRALRMRAAMAFKGLPWVCGHAVNSQILLCSRLNRDSGWAKTYPSSCDYGHVWHFTIVGQRKKTWLLDETLDRGIFFVISCWLSLLSHWNSYLSLWNRKLRIFTKGLITMLRHNWHSYM